MTSNKITIDPVTRVEGHGRVTVQLDDAGHVQRARFHIVEFRGFERFIQGHPYWEAPLLVQRLCGICPVSHHLAAAKAIDQIYGYDPEDLHPTATKIRRLLHFGQIFQSHALHFFYLASPDLLFGVDAPVEKRSVGAVALDREGNIASGTSTTSAGRRSASSEPWTRASTGSCSVTPWTRRPAIGESADTRSNRLTPFSFS